KNEEELASRKRKQHCQHSAYSFRTLGFVRRVHAIMDENRGKSMRDILPNISKLDLRVSVDADAYVETLQTIVVKPPWMDSVVNIRFGSTP
ncbi:unnamed protein product, partial [Hymenolepis diminuta]